MAFSKINKDLFRSLVQSRNLDLLGVAIVLYVCISRDFLGTVYQSGEIQFGVPLSELFSTMKSGAFPLGVFSTIGAIISLLGTRFVGKQDNLGNIFGVITSVTSGLIDFLFGNHSAVITYPITFIIHNYAVKNWSDGVKIRKRDKYYYLISFIGLALGFALVYLGAYLFGGRTDHGFLILVSLIFGISLGANFCNALKYEETWLSWLIYNTIQLFKNLMQLNLANVAKYVFYLFNSFITLMDWRINGDFIKPKKAVKI